MEKTGEASDKLSQKVPPTKGGGQGNECFQEVWPGAKAGVENSRGQKQLASTMGHVVWEGSSPRSLSEHSFHGLKMRDLDSQREEGILCGRNGTNQGSETGMSKSQKNREAPGQRPREMRSGQTHGDGVRTRARSRGPETGTSEEVCIHEAPQRRYHVPSFSKKDPFLALM